MILCLWPVEQVSKLNAPLSDKWAHFLAFAGLTFVWLCTFKAPRSRHYILTIISGLLLGYLIELLQLTLTFLGRSYEVMDIVADGAGVAAGALIFGIFRCLIAPFLSHHQL